MLTPIEYRPSQRVELLLECSNSPIFSLAPLFSNIPFGSARSVFYKKIWAGTCLLINPHPYYYC